MSPRFIESAAWFFGVSAVVLTAFAAVLGCLAWYFSYQSSEIKRVALESFQRESKVAIASAEARGAEANEKAAKANERAAALENEAATARLKLEELRQQVAPRHVDRTAFLAAIKGQPKAHVDIVYLRDDPECFDVAQQLWRVLQDAEWDVAAPTSIPFSVTTDPSPMSVDGQPSGISVVTNGASEKEIEASSGFILGRDDWERTPFTVLQYALSKAIGKFSSHAGGPNRPPKGTLRLVVAPRTGGS